MIGSLASSSTTKHQLTPILLIALCISIKPTTPATNHPFGCEQRRQVPGSRVSLTSATLRLSKANSMSSPPVTEVSIKLDYGRASPVKLCLSPDTSLVFPALGEEKWAGTEGATLERLHSPTTSQHTQRAATGNGRSKILSSSRSTPQTVGLARDSRTILQSLPSRSTTKVSPKTLFLFFLSASRPNPPPCCQSSPKLTTLRSVATQSSLAFHQRQPLVRWIPVGKRPCNGKTFHSPWRS
ncbi:hypothetical protein BKA70DRAFT_884271 [Coprinopsis sp. MPI-PUGE-AT-0042]|nr:hypothetical protein BKA70DRAFT_884271 [Coprinopsis sp. MPI-PUGE-AT-0042]